MVGSGEASSPSCPTGTGPSWPGLTMPMDEVLVSTQSSSTREAVWLVRGLTLPASAGAVTEGVKLTAGADTPTVATLSNWDVLV